MALPIESLRKAVTSMEQEIEEIAVRDLARTRRLSTPSVRDDSHDAVKASALSWEKAFEQSTSGHLDSVNDNAVGLTSPFVAMCQEAEGPLDAEYFDSISKVSTTPSRGSQSSPSALPLLSSFLPPWKVIEVAYLPPPSSGHSNRKKGHPQHSATPRHDRKDGLPDP